MRNVRALFFLSILFSFLSAQVFCADCLPCNNDPIDNSDNKNFFTTLADWWMKNAKDSVTDQEQKPLKDLASYFGCEIYFEGLLDGEKIKLKLGFNLSREILDKEATNLKRFIKDVQFSLIDVSSAMSTESLTVNMKKTVEQKELSHPSVITILRDWSYKMSLVDTQEKSDGKFNYVFEYVGYKNDKGEVLYMKPYVILSNSSKMILKFDLKYEDRVVNNAFNNGEEFKVTIPLKDYDINDKKHVGEADSSILNYHQGVCQFPVHPE